MGQGRYGTMRQWALALALTAYSAALAVGSLSPVTRNSPLAGGPVRQALNNLLHVPAYAVLACLWFLTVRQLRPGATLKRAYLAAATAALAYGGAMELGQNFVRGRTCSFDDFLLNALGVTLAAMVLWAWGRRAAPQASGAPSPRAK